jgi:hypothetical protein
MNEDSEYRGLSETPLWRWIVYTVAFIGILMFLSHQLNDRTILWGGMAGGAVVTSCFWGMNAILINPKGRAFVLRNLGLLLAIYVLGTLALYIWDTLHRK